MTKQQPIQTDATSAVTLQIPLEMLYISDLNSRKAVSEAHIESLADSIDRFGLIQNLAGPLLSRRAGAVREGGATSVFLSERRKRTYVGNAAKR